MNTHRHGRRGSALRQIAPVIWLCTLRAMAGETADDTLCFEAEHANRMTAPMQPRVDDAGSAGICIGIPEGAGAREAHARESGIVVYGVHVARAARYTLWMRVLWEDDCGNSVAVQFDQGPQRSLTGGRFKQWQWLRAAAVRLDAGDHQLTLAGREDGVWIDQLLLTPHPRRVPDGPQPTTCIPGQPRLPDGCPALDVWLTGASPALRPKTPHIDLLGHPGSQGAPSPPTDGRPEIFLLPGQETTLSVWLRNNDLSELKGTVQLSLPDAVTMQPAESVDWALASTQALGNVGFTLHAGKELPIGEHPLRIRVQHDGQASVHAVTLIRPLEWRLAGPFPFSGREITHAPAIEPALLTAARPPAPLDGSTWKAPPLDRAYTPFGLLDLRRIFGETQNALVYAVTELDANQAGEATLFLSADDQCIAWLNGDEVGRVTTSLPATFNTSCTTVSLKEGRNRLLIKLSQERGYWEFMARITPLTEGLVVRGVPVASGGNAIAEQAPWGGGDTQQGKDRSVE